MNRTVLNLFVASLLFISAATAGWSNNPKVLTPSQNGFEKNVGQITGTDAQRVQFRLETPGLTVFLLNNAITYQFIQWAPADEVLNVPGERPTPRAFSTHRIDMQLVGANLTPRITTHEPLSHYNRYSSADLAEAHAYQRVVYHDVYDGIDWVFFINDAGVKHEFIVHPGADPSRIAFEACWADALATDQEGNLIITSRLGTVTEESPVSFQGNQRIATRFNLQGNTVSYDLANYDSTKPLVIDPQLIWGSYYGGESTEGISSVTTDSQGNVYFCGSTQSFDGIAEGGFLNTNPLNGGFFSAFLVKFTPDGDRIWGTFYGGGGFTTATACAVDSNDNVYMAGGTSDNIGIAANGFQNNISGPFIFDAYLVKFNPAGQRIWGTYLGGNNDDGFDCMTIDGNDHIYVAGSTLSSNLPVLNALQNVLNAPIGNQSQDAVIAKFDTDCNLLACTYFGGPGQNRVFDIAHNANGDIFICGRTTSSSFPVFNAHQSTSGNAGNNFLFDAFLTKINADGTLGWSTYYGGSDSDVGWGCATDNLGNVYLAGNTGSFNNIAANGFLNSISFGSASFLVKFNSTGVRQWGTYYGFSEFDWSSNTNIGFDCATDSQNDVYLVGRTNASVNVAFQGFQNTLSGGFSPDAYIVKFNTLGQRLWGTYYGGDFNDTARRCHVDEADQLYIVGDTNSNENIFFNGFQSTTTSTSGLIAKIGCPTPQLVNFPAQVCANSSVSLLPLPLGGSLQLLGEGSLTGNTFTAPNVNTNTEVTFQYSINATNFCQSAAQQFTLTVLPNTTASVAITTTEAAEICAGDELNFEAEVANAGTDPAIQWLVNGIEVATNQTSFASSNLNDGAVVQCIVTGNNPCANPAVVSSNSIVVTVNPNPSVSLVFSSINGGTLFATSGLASYQWFFEGTLIEGAIDDFYVPTAIGTYTVLGFTEFGCSNAASVLVSEIDTTSVETLQGALSFFVYPNPTRGHFTVEMATHRPWLIELYDGSGRVVFTRTGSERLEVFDIPLAAGVYLVRTVAGANSSVQRLVVE